MNTIKVKYYHIDEAAARRAKEANSFGDYIPLSATENYISSVDKAVEIATAQKAKTDPMYHEKIDELLDRYARKLAENLNDGYRIEAMCPSIMVAGPANFPVRKKERQNAARDRNMSEYNDIQRILDKIKSVGTGGISSDDPHAIEKLREKLARLETMQHLMKTANAYYKKHKTLEGCPGVSDTLAREIAAGMANSWRSEPRPFEAYELSNNNANIRRIKERIAELEKRQSEPAPEGWTFDGGEVVINTELNRLQIVLDGRPDDDMKRNLKANGFRWAPSQGAWQRQLTENAINAARSITSKKA